MLLFIFAVCCDSDFHLSSSSGIAKGDETFSSPITVPLYTNTLVETNSDDSNNSTSEDQNNLRPRYNIAPNLGNRIGLVSAQMSQSLPKNSPVRHAAFNTSTPNNSTTPTTPNSKPNRTNAFDSLNTSDNLPLDNLVDRGVSYDLFVEQNKFVAANNVHNQYDEVLPLEIPQTPDCNNDSSSYYKIFHPRVGYFLDDCNQRSNSFFCDGWVAGGIFFNASSPEEKTNPIIQYNDRDREFVMNQLYISFGSKLTRRRNTFEFGGQIDLLYGTDYFYTSALGLETRRSHYMADGNALYPEEATTKWNASHGKRRDNSAALYGLSLPQAYSEIRLPFYWDTTIKAGHFYADAGIESATAVRNFFYSHSYNFMFGQPTTLTGVLVTADIPANYYSSQCRQTLIFGITQGWDMFDHQGGLNYIIGTQSISRRNEQNYVSFIAQIGQQSDANSNDRVSYTLAINRRLSERWTDSFEHTFGYEKDGAMESFDGVNIRYGKSYWISVAKYLTYEISSQLSVGLRAEWFRDDGIARILKSPINSLLFSYTGKNYYEITLGANWKPTRNITIRPELRFDWSDVKVHSPIIPNMPSGSYDGKSNMTSFAVDAVLRF
ncbi:MAG: porin [Planctomycetaceae bacterium]|nr:porin [Planctomycetaceae bacterium]